LEEAQTTLLIVEDDLDIADMLNAYFRVQGYAVQTVNWGEDGVRACLSQTPGLVILDIRLPDIDGFEVARRLRADRRTRHIPIIFLTEKRERTDRLRGLELHADDYITKPFDIQELRLRVRNALQRARQGTLTNPITGLPEGGLVDEALTTCLEQEEGALMIVSLKNLNRFREVYGFVASDDLLRAVSLMVHDSVRDLCLADAFLGHLTASDFLVITHPSQAQADAHTQRLRECIRKRLEQSFDYFYSDQDREQGTFRDRQLGVQFNDLHINALQPRDIAHLKAELAQFCH
jgi:DNA-binding response OmpR family regulator